MQKSNIDIPSTLKLRLAMASAESGIPMDEIIKKALGLWVVCYDAKRRRRADPSDPSWARDLLKILERSFSRTDPVDPSDPTTLPTAPPRPAGVAARAALHVVRP